MGRLRRLGRLLARGFAGAHRCTKGTLVTDGYHPAVRWQLWECGECFNLWVWQFPEQNPAWMLHFERASETRQTEG